MYSLSILLSLIKQTKNNHRYCILNTIIKNNNHIYIKNYINYNLTHFLFITCNVINYFETGAHRCIFLFVVTQWMPKAYVSKWSAQRQTNKNNTLSMIGLVNRWLRHRGVVSPAPSLFVVAAKLKPWKKKSYAWHRDQICILFSPHSHPKCQMSNMILMKSYIWHYNKQYIFY